MGATVLALALGLLELGEPALSYDEAYTVGVVRGSFADTWARVTSFDTVQAPYYLLFSAWYELGEQEWLLRLPSVAFFVATVPLLYALGRRLVDARAGAVAAALLALNGLALAWAQMARSYAMALFLVTALSLLLARAVERPASSARAVAYGLVAVVAVYAHFLVGLVVAAHLASLLLLQPRPRRFLAVAGGIVAVATVPAAAWVLTLRSDPLEWIARPSPRYLLSMLADVAGGGPVQLVLLGPLGLLGAALAWSCHRRRPGSTAAWGLAVPVLWLALPVVTLIASTYTVKPLLHPRYLVIVVPAAVLLVATGLVWLVEHRRRLAALAVPVALAAAVAGAVGHFASNDTHDWRTATVLVERAAGPGDALVAVPANALNVVEYYQRQLPGPDVPTLLPQLGDPATAPQLWVIERTRLRPRDPRAWNPMPDFEAWRDRNYQLAEEHRISPQVTVRRYEARP